MPEGIGDMFRFDVTGTPCPIADGGDRGGGRSGEFPQVVHQSEEQFHGAEASVCCRPVADAFTKPETSTTQRNRAMFGHDRWQF